MSVLDRLHLRRRRRAVPHGRQPATVGAPAPAEAQHEHVRGWAKKPGGSSDPDAGLAGLHQPPDHDPRVRSWAKEPGGDPDPDAGLAGAHRPPAHEPHVRPWAKEPGGTTPASGTAPADLTHEEDAR